MKPNAAGRSGRQGVHALLKLYLICFTIKNDKRVKETKRSLHHSTIALMEELGQLRKL